MVQSLEGLRLGSASTSYSETHVTLELGEATIATYVLPPPQDEKSMPVEKMETKLELRMGREKSNS